MPRAEWPPQATDRVSYIVSSNGKPVLAISSVFQTATGGRQNRDLTVNLPQLHKGLAEIGLRMSVIADGRGLQLISRKLLETVFASLDSFMTLRQAGSGLLTETILGAIENPLQSVAKRSLELMVERVLRERISVSVDELPIERESGQRELAAFMATHPALDLELSADLLSLRWRKQKDVLAANSLARDYDPSVAIRVAASSLGLMAGDISVYPRHAQAILTGWLDDPVFPASICIVAIDSEPTAESVSQVATTSLYEAPESRIALLMCPAISRSIDLTAFRASQALLTANVVLLDTEFVRQLATSTKSPRELLATRVLEQSDLVKASPFVLNSTTPSRMFYGREEEEAIMASTLISNSVALLGSRRIGKTSLMRHVSRRLESAGYRTYFGDCQTVKDWDGFARLAKRNWGIKVQSPFVPENLFQIVSALRGAITGPLVILLDEIDQLLAWDKEQSDGEVTEAFFRACRAISQEGTAQFVFSGERVITSRLWDPESPHWNFCQPLMLRQLTQSASAHLLIRPLEALGVVIDDVAAFANVVWTRSSGHPQIIQFLGDQLIHALNDRLPVERGHANSADLLSVVESHRFAEHYLETYWGQATKLERLLSVILSQEGHSFTAIKSIIREYGIVEADDALKRSLRMIELYGFIDTSELGYCPRLEWFNSALAYYGERDDLIKLFAEGAIGRVS